VRKLDLTIFGSFGLVVVSQTIFVLSIQFPVESVRYSVVDFSTTFPAASLITHPSSTRFRADAYDEVEYRKEVADTIGMGFNLLPEKPIVRIVRKKSVKIEMEKVA
jgi:hypothetical protein